MVDGAGPQGSGITAAATMVLVLVVMQLLGERNWWLPEWLDRQMRRLELEVESAGTR